MSHGVVHNFLMSTRSAVYTAKLSSINSLVIGSKYVSQLLSLQMCWIFFYPFVYLLSRAGKVVSTEISCIELLDTEFMVMAF